MHSCPLHNSPLETLVKRRYLRELMQGVSWLQCLDETELDWLLQGGEVHVADSRHWLFRQETPAHWVYMVISGAARLVRATSDGRLATIRCVERGGMLGELSLVSTSNAYLYSAEALNRTQVLAISANRYRDILQQHVECHNKFMAQLSNELAERLEDMALLTHASGMARLVSFILRQLP